MKQQSSPDKPHPHWKGPSKPTAIIVIPKKTKPKHLEPSVHELLISVAHSLGQSPHNP
jgi:hypothetical protein